MRVLLVEDDRMIGQAVQTALRQDGYAVDWVRDADTADTALATGAGSFFFRKSSTSSTSG